MKDYQEYRKSELNPAIKRFIRDKELELDRTCRKTWHNRNPNGEIYLYGSFCKNRDRLFVTIGYYNESVNGKFIPARG